MKNITCDRLCSFFPFFFLRECLPPLVFFDLVEEYSLAWRRQGLAETEAEAEAEGTHLR